LLLFYLLLIRFQRKGAIQEANILIVMAAVTLAAMVALTRAATIETQVQPIIMAGTSISY